MSRNRRGYRYPGEEIRSAERQAEAMSLRKQGWTFAQIGEHLGVTGNQACRIIQKAMAKTIQEPAESLRKHELDRLDEMFVKVYSQATKSGGAVDNKTIETALKIMERRAKLLGLDMPTNVNIKSEGTVEVTGGVQIYIPDNNRDK